MNAAPTDRQSPRTGLQPGQFGLRFLLLLMLGASVLFAILGAVGPVAKLGIIWLLVMVMGHVWATAVGTHLRRQRSDLVDDDGPPPERVALSVTPQRSTAAQGHLHMSTRLGRRPLVVGCAGAVLGGSVGAVLLSLTYWDRASYAGLVLGTLCLAALGGFLAFLATSFLQVALRSLREAAAGASRHGPYEPRDGHRRQLRPTR